jgi:hypothetical protein
VTYRQLLFPGLYAHIILYATLVRSTLEYASVVWDSITSSDAHGLELIQQRFAALCLTASFPVPRCAILLHKLHPLRTRRHRIVALFLIHVYLVLKFCPSVLETVGLRVAVRYIRDFARFKLPPPPQCTD